MKLGFWDFTPFQIGILGFQEPPLQGPYNPFVDCLYFGLVQDSIHIRDNIHIRDLVIFLHFEPNLGVISLDLAYIGPTRGRSLIITRGDH